MKYVVSILVLTIVGCSVRNFKYDRKKLIRKWSGDYTFYLDDDKIELDTLILDRDNIKSTTLNKESQSITLKIIEARTFVTIQSIIDSLKQSSQIRKNDSISPLIIIDGIPYENKNSLHLSIDPEAINQISILRDARTSGFHCGDPSYNEIVLILTNNAKS